MPTCHRGEHKIISGICGVQKKREPMILDKLLWFPSILSGICWAFMNEDRKSMKALGGRGMCEASLRLSLELVRVGPSEGELGGDMMNMVGGGGGPVDTENIGSS